MGVLSQGVDTFRIEPKRSTKTSEATVIAVASDWHVEENVGKEVGGLNTYTWTSPRSGRRSSSAGSTG
jgi:hypothetical protein